MQCRVSPTVLSVGPGRKGTLQPDYERMRAQPSHRSQRLKDRCGLLYIPFAFPRIKQLMCVCRPSTALPPRRPEACESDTEHLPHDGQVSGIAAVGAPCVCYGQPGSLHHHHHRHHHPSSSPYVTQGRRKLLLVLSERADV